MKDLLRRFLPHVAANAGKNLEQKTNPLVALHGFGDAAWSSGEYSSLTREGYLKNPVVHRCIRMTAEAAASIPWLLYDDNEEMDTHPLLELLAKPNHRQAGQSFLEVIYSNLLVSGNAYILKSELDNAPRELHSLRPDKIEAICDIQGWPTAFDYNLGSQKIRYSNTDAHEPILHVSLYNPLSEIEGLPPLSTAHMALDIHNAASRWNKALLDNSARPSGALVYSTAETSNLTEEQFDRLKSELEDGYSGASRAGRPMLLEGGLDWKAMGLTPKDMDFIEAKNSAARDIALAFGIPPMLLGIPGDNTYANYAEANRCFWRQTVLPLVTRVGASLEQWLSPTWSQTLRLDIDRDKIEGLAVDREALWKRINEADFLTPNEKRAATGYGELGPQEIDQLTSQGI